MTKTKYIFVAVVIGIVTILIMPQVLTKNEHNSPSMHSQHNDKSGVTSLDVSYVNGTIHMLLGKQNADLQSVWYQSSHDQGVTWSQAVNVIENVDVPAKFKRGNDLRLAVQDNNIVAVWMTEKEGVRFNAGPMMTMRSDDDGKTWQVATLPTEWLGSHGFFAMDAHENVINLVWLDNREQNNTGSQGLRFSQTRDGGLSWSSTLTLDDMTCSCCWNTVAFDNDGLFYVLYRDKQPSDMAIGRIDSQLNWQRLSSVGEFNWQFEGCPHVGGGFAIEPVSQRFHATVATGHTDKAGLYYLNSDTKGKEWTAPMKLGNTTAVHSDVAVSNQGNVLAVWDQLTEDGLEVVYASSQDNGVTWSEQATLSQHGLSASHPRIVTLKDSFFVLWTELTVDGRSQLQTTTIAFHE